jgi:glycosyltransferase involved in cell wall biosynthesis
MKVSIIIPVFNVEPYIERCLLSALNQTYQDVEIILVDDCGPDNSMTVAQQVVDNHPYGYKVRIMKHKQNGGLSAARNTGTKEATGKYVYYLDSDDEIVPRCIDILVELATKYQGVDIIQGNTQTMPMPPKKKDWRNILYKDFPEYADCNKWIYSHFYDITKEQIPMNATNKLIKRKFIVENNFFFKEGIIHEDDMWMFLVVKNMNSIAFTTDYTYVAYRTPGSIMQSGDNYKSIQSWYIILEEIFKDFDDPYLEYFKEKYIRILHSKMCLINLKTRESELYNSYKILVKSIIKKFSEKKRMIYVIPLSILLIPQSLYKSFIGKKTFNLLCRFYRGSYSPD